MNEQRFANVRLHRGKVQSAILILSCFLGPILLAQPNAHGQVGGQPQHDSGAAGVGVDSDSKSKQVIFSVGGRPQRVRFMIAAHGQTFDQMQKILGPEGSASIRKLIDDPIQSLPNVPQGKYIRQAKPPAAPGVGLDSFAEGDNFYAGEVINPGLVMCNANLLNLVKAAGDERASLFKSRAINEINLFVRAVPEPTGQ